MFSYQFSEAESLPVKLVFKSSLKGKTDVVIEFDDPPFELDAHLKTHTWPNFLSKSKSSREEEVTKLKRNLELARAPKKLLHFADCLLTETNKKYYLEIYRGIYKNNQNRLKDIHRRKVFDDFNKIRSFRIFGSGSEPDTGYINGAEIEKALVYRHFDAGKGMSDERELRKILSEYRKQFIEHISNNLQIIYK